jgi:hypothetical protein
MAACKLCIHPDRRAIAEAFAAGLSDRTIGAKFNVSHMGAYRHRVEHIVKPARVAAAAIDRGRARRDRRAKMTALADNDPLAITDALFNVNGLAQRLRKVEDRLEAASEKAAASDAHRDLAGLASQQIKSLETTARLGSVGGYAAPRDRVAGGEGWSTFSVTIILDGKEHRIATAPGHVPPPPEIEGEVAETENGEDFTE